MTVVTVNVDRKCFPPTYIKKAAKLFLSPSPRYPWDEIVSGAPVQSKRNRKRRMFAVADNTFRGFHKIDKTCLGAKQEFINYFRDRQTDLVQELAGVRSRVDLHTLSKGICKGIRSRLGNIKPIQLESYNKVRKPVDLYVEHLVAMAKELDEHRSRLIPLLFLPLDSQILAHPCLFSNSELRAHNLNRNSTYSEIKKEESYGDLQEKLSGKAESLSDARRPFHVIYFDLLWNDRWRNPGGNLFETNP